MIDVSRNSKNKKIMYNTITAVGYVVADPEVRTTSTGKKITKIRVGISPSRAKEKCFIDVEFWEKLAEVAEKYLSKGREFLFTGELATESWEPKGGEGKRYKNFIRGKDLQFLNSGNKQSSNSNSNSNSDSSTKESSSIEDEDDIPF